MRKKLGEEIRKAREAAAKTLKQFNGRNIKTLKDSEVRDLLAAVMQLLGLADRDGNIK